MTWLKVTNIQGFSGAEAVYEAEGWLIARWNHDQCRGWQLYCRPNTRSQRTKWMMGGGIESLDWTDEQAQGWAEKQIAATNEQPPHGGA